MLKIWKTANDAKFENWIFIYAKTEKVTSKMAEYAKTKFPMPPQQPDAISYVQVIKAK